MFETRRNPSHWFLILIAGATLWTAPAAADQGLLDLELTIPIAIADRSSTGSGEALAGYGYDDQTGLLTGGELRLYTTEFNPYIRVGLIAGGQQMAGPLLGLEGGHAYRTTILDAGVAVRTVFPCMSSRETRWHLSGLLAMTGVHADAGEGVGGEVNGDRYAERQDASERLDHAGLGWRLAFDLSVHLSNFIVGLGLGVRQYFGIDAPVSRGWVMDVGLRVGGRIDFTGLDPV